MQERELEEAWFIKRIHCRVMGVYIWYTNGVIGNPLVTVQGQTFIVPVFPLPIFCYRWRGRRATQTVVSVAMCVSVTVVLIYK